jgi:hypothetical protein
LLAPRAGAEGAGGGVVARRAGGGVGRGDAGRASLRDRDERRGGLRGRGLWRRCGFTDRRGEGAGEPLRRDWRARQVPRRPLPFVFPLSEGGGVEKRRLGVKRDDRRTSHGRADGRSIMSRLEESMI